VTDVPVTPSYRALLGVPTLPRLIVSMQFARIAQSMLGIVLVLFTLTRYASPALAGIVTFAATFPSVVVSPIAGALLDRHGRIRLVILDYLVAAAALLLIALLAVADRLPAELLIVIAVAASLTVPFSHTGLRSLFPILVPRHLWERANAIDSNGYLIASILGPPIAAALFAIAGGPLTMVVIAVAFGAAAVAVLPVHDPPTDVASTGSLLRDAWQGLVYAWRNPTIRGLGFAVSVLNVWGGMLTIVTPLLVLQRLGLGEAWVGIPFAISGVAGMLSGLYYGRHDTRGREHRMLVWPVVGVAIATSILLPVAAAAPAGQPGAIDPALGFGLIAVASLANGYFNGPFDIALFTVRQRRTDPAWMGRAFAISMAFNFLGYPIGAALTGAIADVSIVAAVALGVAAASLSAVLAATMVPRTEP
jgi:MFS family permease